MSVWTEALDDAAKELGLPKDSWTVEKLATLRIALQLARSKWASGNTTASADLLQLMGEITTLRANAGLDVPREITVKIATGLHATCPRCGYSTPVDSEKLKKAVKVEPVGHDSISDAKTLHDASNGLARTSTDDQNPPPAPVPVSAQRVGVSASRFHSQVINGHEVPPLKRQTSRLISPMSVPTPTKG
jgi:hypothetical protein